MVLKRVRWYEMASILEGAIFGLLLWEVMPAGFWWKLLAVFLTWFFMAWDISFEDEQLLKHSAWLYGIQQLMAKKPKKKKR